MFPRKLISQILFLDGHLSYALKPRHSRKAGDFCLVTEMACHSEVAAGGIANVSPGHHAQKG